MVGLGPPPAGKGSAHIAVDDPDLAGLQAKGLGQRHLVHGRTLGRGPDVELVGIGEVGQRHVQLRERVVLHGGTELIGDDEIAGGKGGVRIAEILLVGQSNVAAGPLVQLRGVGLHGAAEGSHGRQHLILDLDEVQRCLGNQRVGGSHGGHLFAHVVHKTFGQQGLFLREQHVGRVHVGHDGLHPGQGPRLRDVDTDDACPRVGAAQDPAMEHPRQDDVVGKDRPARHLLEAVKPRLAAADNAEVFRLAHAVLLRVRCRTRPRGESLPSP